jgi:uncharacterized protein (DUF1501 family)
MSVINRRDFLKAAGAGAALGVSPLAGFGQTVGSAASLSNYRALVCIYLFGGNDSFNMVVPRSVAKYNAYAASRQNLAVPRDSLLRITPLNSDGVNYGLHPALPELRNLFRNGNAAFINNVGTLVQPVTKEKYLDDAVNIPPQLFSHNSQQDQWQTLKGLAVSRTGWGGRIADMFRDDLAGQRFPTNISLHGDQLMLTANATTPYVMGLDGPAKLVAFNGTFRQPQTYYQQQLREAYERVLAGSHKSVYGRAFAESQQRALQSYETIRSAIADAEPVAVQFSSSDLGRQLRTVANLISAREQLQMKRQIFFVGAGGFDTHDYQNEFQPQLYADLSKCLGDFYLALQQLGVADSVTAFTQSDFGRTLTSNGDGTDHGWGGIQVVVGGAVDGSKFFGTYPELSMGGPDEVSGGRLIPTTSADQYVATLSKWLGVPAAGIEQIVPNIGNFAQRDLGFMG